ncbi:FimV family protein [Bordetella sp. 15P40C-2]|uniref:type IV pilus assembly protein FimV n=1 Tax=Bordetella sp. 15P40C-2 TaxID=2572246 RepID=UPI00132AFA94|nr:hypothetical protein [Bordetella sp. 15P40C-2]MVW73293.1 hypothetical protein [Bordetella sp. 15P40C-2]
MYFALCKAIERAGLSANVRGILIDEWDEGRQSSFESGNSEFSFSELATVDTAATYLAAEFELDMVHVHAQALGMDKTREQVLTCIRHLSEKSLLLFSGVPGKINSGPAQAFLRELKNRYQYLSFPGPGGFTIFLTGIPSSPELEFLYSAAAEPANATLLRLIFENLEAQNNRLTKTVHDGDDLRAGKTAIKLRLEETDRLRSEMVSLSRQHMDLMAKYEALISTNANSLPHTRGLGKNVAEGRPLASAPLEAADSRKLAGESEDALAQIKELQTLLAASQRRERKLVEDVAALSKMILTAHVTASAPEGESTAKSECAAPAKKAEDVPAGNNGPVPPVTVLSKPIWSALFWRRKSKGLAHADRRLIEIIEASGLFDAQWYLATYPEVTASKMSPIEHYLKLGAAQGYNPGPRFDAAYYLNKYSDVAKANMNPLIHYIKHGRFEGRKPSANGEVI